jgi:hypothetical protein
MPETNRSISDPLSAHVAGIRGIDHLDGKRLAVELERGARFVSFSYCVSLLLVSFRRSSGVIYVPPETLAQWAGSRYLLVTLLLGWWAIPWGPIYALGCIWQALRGGEDCTWEIVEDLDLIFPDGFADESLKQRMRSTLLER